MSTSCLVLFWDLIFFCLPDLRLRLIIFKGAGESEGLETAETACAPVDGLIFFCFIFSWCVARSLIYPGSVKTFPPALNMSLTTAFFGFLVGKGLKFSKISKLWGLELDLDDDLIVIRGAVGGVTVESAVRTDAVRRGADAVRRGADAVRMGAGAVRMGAGAVRRGAGAVRRGAGAVRMGAGAVRRGAGAVRRGAGAVRRGAGAVRGVRGPGVCACDVSLGELEGGVSGTVVQLISKFGVSVWSSLSGVSGTWSANSPSGARGVWLLAMKCRFAMRPLLKGYSPVLLKPDKAFSIVADKYQASQNILGNLTRGIAPPPVENCSRLTPSLNLFFNGANSVLSHGCAT